MKKLSLLLLGGIVLTAGSLLAYDEKEYTVRPWEIIKGLQPHSKLLWDMQQDGIKDWRVSGKEYV